MIVIASKYVNTRLELPHTSAVNPTFLEPGHQLDVLYKVYGETIEGNNVWFGNKENEFHWSGAFHPSAEAAALPVNNQSAFFDEWRIAEFWKKGIRGQKVKVAVIDSGFNINNPAIKHALRDTPELKLPDTGHGTYMSSIICGNDITKGYLGLAPDIELHICEIDTANDKISMPRLMDILKTLNGFDIISMSFAFFDVNFPNLQAQFQQVTDPLIKNNNTIIVAATGNKGMNDPRYPAGYNDIISVGGLDDGGQSLATLSNFWKGVKVAAPYKGYFTKIDETTFRSDFHMLPGKSPNGTSSSTAFISGLLALVKSAYKLKNQEFKNADIKQFLTPITLQRGTNSFNSSIIDQQKFFNLLK